MCDLKCCLVGLIIRGGERMYHKDVYREKIEKALFS